MKIKIENLVKEFESYDKTAKEDRKFKAVDDVTFAVERGEMVTLLGPSGCGKTTILRMVAGFEDPTSGDIFFGDERMNDVPPNKRDAALVFQSYALFPHLSIRENIAFGLELRRVPEAEQNRRIDETFELVELEGLGERRPDQLSGGQQQRVALARAIIMEPRLLLFDEPLSNLDAKLREQMRIDIRSLQQRLGITSLYVTHDQTEAMSISDRVIVMNSGKLEQIGPPRELYEHPRNRFVATFIGKANFIPSPNEENKSLMLRPEYVRLLDEGESGDFTGVVARATYLGGMTEYEVNTGHGTLVALEQNSHLRAPFSAGQGVSVKISGSVEMESE